MSTIRYPNLFLAGAPKCGTTSLANWMAQHPDIFMPIVKEPIYFASDLTSVKPAISEEEYLSLYRNWQGERYAVDATTHNFYSKVSAQRIAQSCPDARIVIVVRNPTDAAYSMFHQLRFNGTEELPDFASSLAAEVERSRHLSPLDRGYPENRLYTQVYDYKTNIGRFVDTFGEGRVSVILLDDLRSDPPATLRAIFRSLSIDVEPADTIDFTVSNSAKRFRSRFLNDLAFYPPKWAGIAKLFLSRETRFRLRQVIGKANTVPQANPPLDPKLREQLDRQFKPQVEWLEDFLKRDLSHWTASKASNA